MNKQHLIKTEELRAILKTEPYLCSPNKFDRYLDFLVKWEFLPKNKRYLSPYHFFYLMFYIVQTAGRKRLHLYCSPFEECEYTSKHPYQIVRQLCTSKELHKNIDLVYIENGYLIVKIYTGLKEPLTIYKAEIQYKEAAREKVKCIPISFFLKVRKMLERHEKQIQKH